MNRIFLSLLFVFAVLPPYLTIYAADEFFTADIAKVEVISEQAAGIYFTNISDRTGSTTIPVSDGLANDGVMERLPLNTSSPILKVQLATVIAAKSNGLKVRIRWNASATNPLIISLLIK
jgi:hypothetical protein